MPIPAASPAGSEKRAIAFRNPSGRHGPLDGASARKKAGIPIVSEDVSVNCRGSSGKIPLGSAIVIEQEGREDRLGDEQPRDALDVAQDLTALVDHLRQFGEIAGDQHEVRHRPRHLGPASLRDREPRLLECRHVVDAIAEHPDILAGLREHPHHARLVVRRDAADRRRRAHRCEQRVVALRQRAAVERVRSGRDPRIARDRADRRRTVTGDDLERDILVAEERHRLDGVVAQPLGQHDEPERAQRPGQRGVRRRRRERR